MQVNNISFSGMTPKAFRKGMIIEIHKDSSVFGGTHNVDRFESVTSAKRLTGGRKEVVLSDGTKRMFENAKLDEMIKSIDIVGWAKRTVKGKKA